MTTSTGSRPRRIRISASLLPSELWLRILSWATIVPGAFSTDAPDVFSYPPPLTQEQIQAEMRHSLRTKRSVVRVCKDWNDLAKRFLYEGIYLGRAKTAGKIVEVLDGSGFGGALEWTKRLDLAIQNAHEDENEFGPVLRVVRSLPNLEIVVTRRKDLHTTFSRRILGELALAVPDQLAVFDSTHELLDITTPDNAQHLTESSTKSWVLDLYKFKNMRQLRIMPHHTPAFWMHRDVLFKLHFPHLQHLVLFERFPLYINMEESAETTSHQSAEPLHLVYLCPNTKDFLEKFFIASPGLCARLTTFEYPGFGMPMVEVDFVMRVLESRCPNLQNVILTVSAIRIVNALVLPRGVERLGISCPQIQERRSNVRRMKDVICNAAETKSSLRVVRFLEANFSRLLVEAHLPIIEEMGARLRDHGVLLEGHDGYPMLR